MRYEESEALQLFDPGDAAWRFEIKIKIGGGPFDPSGVSLQVIRPDGSLAYLGLVTEETSEYQAVQLGDLLRRAGAQAKLTHQDPGKWQTRSM